MHVDEEYLVAMGRVSVEEGKIILDRILSESMSSSFVRQTLIKIIKPLLENQFKLEIKNIAAQIAQSTGWTKKV